MTEEYEDGWSVGVRAQVMTRDEATGGWVALGGGGLSHVMLKRFRVSPELEIEDPNRALSHPPQYEYTICGIRISDETEVLSCIIKKDFQYHKVMPTFHHWVTGEKRFGLTFQTAADARAFDRGVRTAVEQLLHGLGGSWSNQPATGPCPDDDDEESNIFECLHLPSESRSSSENSTASRPTQKHGDNIQTPILTAITRTKRSSPTSGDTSLKHYNMSSSGTEDDRIMAESNSDTGAYVHLTAVHEYTYPQVGPGVITSEKSSPSSKPSLMRRDSGHSIKKADCPCIYTPPPLPDKKISQSEHMQSRLKCRHCHEWYLESGNHNGSCQYAPDCFKSCIEAVSCIKCAQCLLYHCMSDPEGDFNMHVCSCGPVDQGCTYRWIGISLLSLLVPCLCFYPPLRLIHRAASSAHISGAKHAPPRSDST